MRVKVVVFTLGVLLRFFIITPPAHAQTYEELKAAIEVWQKTIPALDVELKKLIQSGMEVARQYVKNATAEGTALSMKVMNSAIDRELGAALLGEIGVGMMILTDAEIAIGGAEFSLRTR